MHSNSINFNITKFLSVIILILTSSTVVNAKENTISVAPDGFKKLALFMGTGLIDPNISDPRPGVTGCAGAFCDGEFFHKVIMKRSEQEIKTVETAAKEYFLTQFGINVDDPALANRISFTSFMVNPDFQYRAYILSGEEIGSEGWLVRAGGFKVTVIDPNGISIGGKQVVDHAPQNSVILFGNYNILKTDKHGNPIDEIITYFKSIDYGAMLYNGKTVLNCAVFNEKYGDGLGLVIFNFIQEDNGLIRTNVRNVETFPPASNIINFHETPAFDESAVK